MAKVKIRQISKLQDSINSEFAQQKEEDGKTHVCDNRNVAITCVFCRDLYLTLLFLIIY